MKLIIEDDYAALSHRGVALIMSWLGEIPDANLLVATGNTPLGLYEGLATQGRTTVLDTSRLKVFQLDEYVGVADDDPRSLFGWMARVFLTPLAIPQEHVVRLHGDRDSTLTCREYEVAVREAGGIDIAILGLGPNGHLGFNEPPSQVDAPTRRVSLSPMSIDSNASYWGSRERVPREALTAGMDVILAAKRVLLVVSGPHKRGILQQTVKGAVTPDVPASLLQQIPNVVVLADRAAGSGE